MARKYQAVNKNGDISNRRIKGGKNLKENYVKVGKQNGRNVYAKKGSGFENEGRTRINANKGKRLTIFEFVRPSGGGGRTVAIRKEEERGQLVEVKGLVSGEYKLKSHPFHCEMLFYWHGNEGFDEKKLLESAYEVMIESLPEIDRITYVLITSENFGPDYQRWGIESVNQVQSGINEQMEFEIFIPGAQSGRVLYNNVAWVKA
jgi:hypothetical protein